MSGMEYNLARKRGVKQAKQAAEAGYSPYPAVLDDLIKNEGKLAEISVGLKEIPLDRIVGTKTAGRTNSFSCAFMPLLEADSEFAAKWSQLYDAQMQEGIRDPIKAYEYYGQFYVEEGNKRVSVARYVGASAIHANVIRLMPRKTDTREYRVYREFLEYFNAAGIYDVMFTGEGSYRKFARCIGQTLQEPWRPAVIEDVKAAYAIFTQVYYQVRGRRWSNLPPGDAFLVYINLFPIQGLLNEPRSVLTDQVNRIWNEFVVDSKEDNVEILESPENAEEGGPARPMGNLGNVIWNVLSPSDWVREKEKTSYSGRNPLHMAFIYPGSAEDSSWIYGHELGRSDLTDRFGPVVQTVRYEHRVTDEAIRDAVSDAVRNHAEMIFTVSPTQMEETLRCAVRYPEVKFLNCSVNLTHSTVRTYYGRMHEAKFLMGALAAISATNHKIGYVADYPIYGIVAGINAFAIGASMIDPRAKIHLKWSTDKDCDLRAEFEEEGVYVISGADFIRPSAASREYGIYVRDENWNVTNLAAPVWNWGRYYELIARIVLNGRWDIGNQASEDRAVNYWWGMSAGVVDVILSEKLPYNTKKLMDMLRQGVISGHYNPFMGELHAQDGRLVRDRYSPGLGSREIITMNWLCDNVVGSLPKKDELVEKAGAAIEVSGVEGTV